MFSSTIRTRLRRRAHLCLDCTANASTPTGDGAPRQLQHLLLQQRPLALFVFASASRIERRFSSSPPAPPQHNNNNNNNNNNSDAIADEFFPDPLMTLQQVHEARQAHEQRQAQIKAEERAQAHEKMQAQEMEASRRRKAERALAASRVNVAKYAVPYLFSTRSDLFAAVMAELNFSSSADVTDGIASDNLVDPTSSRDDGSPAAQYKGIYVDSIPSFVQQLLDAPETLFIPLSIEAGDTDRFPDTCPANILLDRLAGVGFADPQFTKHHRQNRKTKSDYARYLQRVRDKIVDFEGRKRKLELFESNFRAVEKETKEVEKELNEINRKGKEESNKDSLNEEKTSVEISPFTSVKNGLTKLLGLEALASTADDPKVDCSSSEKSGTEPPQIADGDKLSSPQIRIHRRLRKLYRRLEKHQNSVKQGTLAVEGAERQLEKLKKERELYQPVLTDEQYQTAAALAGDTMKYFCPAFARHLHGRHKQLIERYRILDAQTDLTKPQDWYPRSRLDRRKIIYHGGPTNSGKTYTALQRLKKADKGLYVGPLRLLAAEIYEQLTSEGVYCNLFTGQEKKEIPFATHSAATVELAPLDRDFDVVVIDEIQMISDEFRGWAWTRALLGLRCKEIHVAGGLEARLLVERLAAACGDEFELNEYDRFSELVISEHSLAKTSNEKGSYKDVQPGDAIVAFSRNDIFAIKREIERTTPYKCCVIYGSLPPQIRTEVCSYICIRQFARPYRATP
jgi:hypothetical protein